MMGGCCAPVRLVYVVDGFWDSGYAEDIPAPQAPNPQLDAFIAFLRNIVGIPASALPDDSISIRWALAWALETVNPALKVAGCIIYDGALFNLAADNIINWAQDLPGETYFAKQRENFGIFTFSAGVVQAAADESTSDSLLVPDFMKHLTLGDLQNLKTPWGRAYLAIAMKFGSLWGLS